MKTVLHKSDGGGDGDHHHATVSVSDSDGFDFPQSPKIQLNNSTTQQVATQFLAANTCLAKHSTSHDQTVAAALKCTSVDKCRIIHPLSYQSPSSVVKKKKKKKKEEDDEKAYQLSQK